MGVTSRLPTVGDVQRQLGSEREFSEECENNLDGACDSLINKHITMRKYLDTILEVYEELLFRSMALYAWKIAGPVMAIACSIVLSIVWSVAVGAWVKVTCIAVGLAIAVMLFRVLIRTEPRCHTVMLRARDMILGGDSSPHLGGLDHVSSSAPRPFRHQQ